MIRDPCRLDLMGWNVIAAQAPNPAAVHPYVYDIDIWVQVGNEAALDGSSHLTVSLSEPAITRGGKPNSQ